MRALQEALDTIRFKYWYYETAKSAGTTAVSDGMTPDQPPEEFCAVRAGLRR